MTKKGKLNKSKRVKAQAVTPVPSCEKSGQASPKTSPALQNLSTCSVCGQVIFNSSGYVYYCGKYRHLFC